MWINPPFTSNLIAEETTRRSSYSHASSVVIFYDAIQFLEINEVTKIIKRKNKITILLLKILASS
jgi:hypothetical protein